MNGPPAIDLIKGSLSKLIDEYPNPQLTFAAAQNKALCETIGMKIYVICIFVRMKIKSFSCETFCTSTPSATRK